MDKSFRAVFVLALLTTIVLAELPVWLCPDNPRWLEWRGPTQVFTISAEYCLKGLKRESVSSKVKQVALGNSRLHRRRRRPNRRN
jgi:hypothetical protein